MSEKDTQKAIMDWLAAKQILAYRMNVGAMQVDKRFLRFGTPGMADVLACPELMCDDGDHRPHFCWIEVKTEKGRQSDLQKSFQMQVESHGHIYILARSLEDVESILG